MNTATILSTRTPERPGNTGPRLAVPDRITVELPADATVLVCSDLHLGQTPSHATEQMQRDLVTRLGSWEGPGAVVLNGDCIELWGEPEGTVAGALAAHPDLTTALHRFAEQPGRTLVLTVGNHDAPIAWDGVSAAVLQELIGARPALQADLVFDTPAGRRVVRCEHGHAYDPANAFSDPRDPLDSPLGQHVVQQILPGVRRAPLLSDVPDLADPNAIGEFVGSRLVYRHLMPAAKWLLIPLVVLLGLRVHSLVRLLSHPSATGRLEHWGSLLGVGFLADLALMLLLVGLVTRAAYGALAGSGLGPRGRGSNAAPLTAASALCAQGLDGLITGHTHQPELAPVPGGFYANTGSGTRVVERRPGRFFLPPVFVPALRRAWVEVDVQRDLRIRLVVAETPSGESTGLERLAARRTTRREGQRGEAPQVVAELPGQAGWPLEQEGLRRRAEFERTRSVAALAVAAVALIGLGSALTSPFRGRFEALLDVLPVQAPQAAAAAVVFLSTALLLLAWGLHRGRSVAWATTLVLLVGSAGLHLIKGLDVEEAGLALSVAAWLAYHRAAFPTHPDRRALRRVLVLLATGTGFVALVSTALVLTTGATDTAGETAGAVAERLIGQRSLPLPTDGALLTPALIAAGISLLIALSWALLRPRRVSTPNAADHATDLARARRIVARYGGGTLDYFALRDDKSWFFTADCLVAYAVRNGVCLVSPDPIGPPEQHADAWAQFTAFADRHGWPISVLGAGEGWLPTYRAGGLRPVYLGDEAIVDCTAFSLEGRSAKSLRGAYNRVRKAGYTVRFYDPATLSAELADELRELATESRVGQTERGFSMTLSRLCDPRDTELLLAVAHAPDGRPDAFCQWVPAADLNGWSLDLMRRRTDEDLPNGLTDFVIIETIGHLKAGGGWGLGLNFAVMRAVLAGERGSGPLSELQRQLLHRFSDGTQMETLWHYNDKFRPLWRPRYVVVSDLSTVAPQGLAIADAEGLTEIPLLGRLLRQRPPVATAVEGAQAGPERVRRA
ncbi:phosphatidylglycerol lysyltransferase domain-containing protein [Cryptosporangium sp. NPDC051539]|uniref:phosphatidylglycerol lysyltransferase domain-containing protein n=1 Tax=Cryptosporangium sp. NPDC051539 TaxID=3363962 RepID=UPI0037A6771A